MISGYIAMIGTISGLMFLVTNLFLTIKLRTRKYEIMHKIADSAPKEIRGKVLLIMEMHMSWVAGSAGSYIWFIYPMLRFGGRVSSADISIWKQEIKKILGPFYLIYWLSTMLLNITFLSLAVFVVNEYWIN